ncbi:NAD(P)/FAD-dependent oxidoreductase [Clostridium chrysemydis]|uniref:NAD(P)/FAD-dependent oxidoreductase n=1 Tax=Clostridium chrysemydis TaxID=2665504 RepID=UPI003F2FDAD5
MKTVVVIGAGPAGMMAAIESSKSNKVILIEKNNKLGKKLYITGKGRCNVTNNKDISEFFDYIPGNPHFLYSSLYTFDNQRTIEFFEKNGVKLKVERGGRIFPNSDKSSDIIKGFERALKEQNIKIIFNSEVTGINVSKNVIESVSVNNSSSIKGDHFIFCTGGASYPLTGSTGDGQQFAKMLGHNIIPLTPSLVPLELNGRDFSELAGLSLRNIQIEIKNKNKILYSSFGEIKFTPFGVTGPLILSGSRYVNDKNLNLNIDLKPALDQSELDKRIQKDFLKYKNSEFKNSLNELLPKKLIPVIINRSGIDENKLVNEITKSERKNLLYNIKNFEFSIKGLRPLAEAIVTSGGVDTLEIDPSTMKSKIIQNLSFAGEIVDVDAFTGGYNVQIALSTGYIAGNSI